MVEKKLTARDKKMFQMGYDLGQMNLTKTLSLLNRTNKRLWDELLRLDRMAPVAGVVLTYKEVERLINILRKNNLKYWGTKLNKKLKKARLQAKLEASLPKKPEL